MNRDSYTIYRPESDAARRYLDSIEAEARIFFAPIELRGKSGDSGATLEGYAAKFGTRSQMFADWWEEWQETIRAGAFAKTIVEADIRALFNHDPNWPLGRNTAGTLTLEEDDTGLRYLIDLPETQQARDLYVSIERGDVSQSSFAFRTVKDDWSYDENEILVRELIEVKLYDVSPVTYPAYLDTEVQARDDDRQLALRSFARSIDRPLGSVIAAAKRGEPLHHSEARDTPTQEPEPIEATTQEPGTREEEPESTGPWTAQAQWELDLLAAE